ncbi:unnamed protein product [Lampetra fluviatilis]
MSAAGVQPGAPITESERPLSTTSSALTLELGAIVAAYPNMDRAALDSLALERLLSLARELGVVLSIAEEVNLSSLKVAQGIQAHLCLRQWPSMAAGTGDLRPLEVVMPHEGEQPGHIAMGYRNDFGAFVRTLSSSASKGESRRIIHSAAPCTSLI